MAFSRKEAAERRQKAHRDIPFAADPAVRVEIAWGAPYWNLVSEVSGRPVGTDAFGTAIALAQLLKEAGAEAWVYEFGIPDLLTHAVCIVQESGRWWVEDAFFDTTLKVPFAEALAGLESGVLPHRSPGRSERVCLAQAEPLSPAGEGLARMATRELSAIEGVRRFVVPLGQDSYAALLDEPDALLEAIEDHGMPAGFDALMLLPVRGVRDGEPIDLTQAPGDVGAWFTGRFLSPEARARSHEAARRRVERLHARAGAERDRLTEELAQLAASAASVEEGRRTANAELDLQFQRLRDAESERDRLQAEFASLTASSEEGRRSAAADLERQLDLLRGAEAERDRLTTELASLTESVEGGRRSAANELDAQLDRLRSAEAERDRFANELAALQATFETSQGASAAALADQSEQRQAAEADRVRLAGELDAVRTAFEAREAAAAADIAAAGVELEGLRAELANAVANAAALADANTTALAEASKSLEALQRQLGESEAERDAGQSRETALEQAHGVTLAAARDETAAIRVEVRQLEQRLEQLRAAADDASNEAAKFRDAVAVAEARVADSDRAVETERSRYETLAVTLAERDSRLATVEGALARSRARAVAALQRAASGERELGHLTQALEETRRNADASLAELAARLEEEGARAAERERTTHRELASARAELETVSESLARSSALAFVRDQEALARISGLEAEVARAAARETDLEAQITEIQLRAQELTAAIADDHQRETAEAEAHERDLRDRLEAVQEELATAAERAAEAAAEARAIRANALELDTARQSLLLAVQDAGHRERALLEAKTGLEAERARLAADVKEALQREVGLQAAIRESGEREASTRGENERRAQLLVNLGAYAAEIAGQASDGADPFDALDRLRTLLAQAEADRARLSADLAARRAASEKQFGARLSRLMSGIMPSRKVRGARENNR